MRGLLLIVSAAMLGAVTVRLLVARRRQTRALRRLAAERRLSFSPEDIIGLHERYQGLELIRRGHSRCASNVLYGSHPAGLVSVFGYSYEVGLGARAEPRHWCIAVVETAKQHGHWAAAPAGSVEAAEFTLLIDRFRVRAESGVTLEGVREAGIENMLQAAPAACRWEIAGPLVAAAVPLEGENAAEQTLDAAIAMAERLNAKTNRRKQREQR